MLYQVLKNSRGKVLEQNFDGKLHDIYGLGLLAICIKSLDLPQQELSRG